MTKRKASQADTIRFPVRKPNIKQPLDNSSHNHFHLGAGAVLATTNEQANLVSLHQDGILAAAERTPRFLFRFWHRNSGGATSGQYNSPAAVTPRAFAEGRVSHLLFDMKQSEFNRIAADHVDLRKDSSTVFSSWSQSLGFVLGLALERLNFYKDTQDIHICILDTKLLSPQNVIINTLVASQIYPYVGKWDCEFLAFGTMSGSAYHTISYDSIRTSLPSFVFFYDEEDRCYPACQTWNQTLNHTRQIISLLPPRYQLPFAAHLLTIHNPTHMFPAECHHADEDARHEDIHAFLHTLSAEILPDLAVDDTVMLPGYAATYECRDAARAIELLRHFVFERLGSGEMGRLRREARPADETPFERELGYRAAQRRGSAWL